MRPINCCLFAIFLTTTPASAADISVTPKIDDAAVLARASGIAAETLTYDFDAYERDFYRSKRNFTPEGWQSFEKAEDSTLQLNITYKQNMYAEQNLATPPRIESEGMKDGLNQWIVSVPLDTFIHIGNKGTYRLKTVKLTLVQVHGPLLTTLYVVDWSEK